MSKEMLERIEQEARRYAGMYPQSSDGRNTFVIFADWIASLPDAGGDRKPITFMDAMNMVDRGFDTWKDKPHNAKWYARIDGTPIPNDLKVNIAEAICQYLALKAAPAK